ncbi:hypothetical protein MATL_G00104710 [Megalops atlanticus]|uniref:SET domain-containing protein n=1 Tax=Megalops atlanticus TaxID=7932 RepID=A0A9D3PYT8_MEGAT|nr:hypothetical protein MATL_G00104710 [Megalops atlanticus]
MPPRISPLNDAIYHVVSKIDKTYKLEVKYINAAKGRGVFAKGSFCKGDFVVEYRGDLINDAEYWRRRRLYHRGCHGFMFAFKWRETTWCIDASREDESFGRLINDDHRHPNCRVKKIDVNGKPHLCLFALIDIKEGEEITYDYGGEDCPWRTQMTSIAKNTMAVKDSHSSRLSKSALDDATGPQSNPEQMTSITVNTIAEEESHTFLLSKSKMDDATGTQNTPDQTTTITMNATMEEDSHHFLLSKSQVDDAINPQNTPDQTTTITANAMMVEDSHPFLLSKSQVDDAVNIQNTPDQTTTITANAMMVEDSNPFLFSKSQVDDAVNIQNTPDQTTTITANAMMFEDSNPFLFSKSQVDDAVNIQNTPDQTTTIKLDGMMVEDSRPSLLSKSQVDDTSNPQNTPEQSAGKLKNKNDIFVPRLRRTKSIIMKDVTDIDSDDLYDSTPSGSEDDYIPDTTNESESDSDATLKPNQKRKRKSLDMLDVSVSMSSPDYETTTSNKMTSDRHNHTSEATRSEEPPCSSQTINDGIAGTGSEDDCIPDTTSESDSDAALKLDRTRKQKCLDMLDVSVSMSSPDYETTTSDKITSDNHNHTSQATTEEELPCSSQTINDGIVVSPYQMKGGKRVYSKRHYCLYCCKPYAKMARHLEHAHEDKSDVAKALSLPKGSKERKKVLDYIRNRGNFAHNAAVMESGKGELVPCRRPPKKAQGKEFMHCAYCQSLLTKKALWRHMRSCRLTPGGVATKPGKNRVQSMCVYTGPVPSHVSKQLWDVISAMTPDPVTDVIKKDRVITDVGQHLLNKGGTSAKNQQHVREKMREMGRLICNARRVTKLRNMEDLINPNNYMETVKAVRVTCGYDSDKNKFLIPSLANKLGNALVKVSKLLKAQGLISNDKELVKNASEFQDVHREKWNEMISATALRNIREAKWNAPTLMPFTEDVQKLHGYLNQKQDEWYNSLSESPSTEVWRNLAKVCLAQIILFNRRREGEVASMPLSAFLSRDTSNSHEDVDWALTETEKKLCRHFTRIVIRGKRGRPVPILVTQKMLRALDLLVKQREACGVLKHNTYMFARPEALSHFRGSDCLGSFAQACGAKHPKLLTSTRLRKHAATLSTVLNMSNSEMDQLANFLGHDIRIHREFYRLPEKTLQLAKISKVLMALEQGRLSEFHGKNLDEVDIDPDEKILDTDDGDGNIQEGTCSSAVDEPTADEALPPTERSEQTPRRRKLSSDNEITSQVSTARPSSEGEPGEVSV